jgi:hypothetical protein
MTLRSTAIVVGLLVGGCSDPESKEAEEHAQAEEPGNGKSVKDEPAASTQAAEASASSAFTFGFEARDHQLWFHSGVEPVLYTVKSKDGKVLAEGIDDATLERDFHELHDIVHTGSDLIGIGYSGER